MSVGLVADVGYFRDRVVLDTVGDLGDDGGLDDHIGDFGYYDADFSSFGSFDLCFAAQFQVSAACGIGVVDALFAADDTAGGEIRCGHDFQDILKRTVGVVYYQQKRIAYFGYIMRRHISRHSDGDAGRAVNEKIGELRRQDGRLGSGFVVVRDKIDGVGFEIFEHLRRRRGHPCFGISHRGGRIGIYASEISLRVDELVSHIPFLAEADQRSVSCLVAVGMIVAAGIADDFRAFTMFAAGAEV